VGSWQRYAANRFNSAEPREEEIKRMRRMVQEGIVNPASASRRDAAAIAYLTYFT
jgi:hypothetical protein